MPYQLATPSVAEATVDAKAVLLIEIAGLGDLVHSLPAMWAVRQAYPHARLHCLVREANASLLRLTPWIDEVIPYRRDQITAILHHLAIARKLRAGHYDVSVELMGADYSCAVAWISGAARRLARKPGQSKRRYGWQLCSTDVMTCSFREEPMYLQKLRCVRQAGFTAPGPVFELTPPVAESPSKFEFDSGAGYVHVSPYTKLTRKELPPEQLAELLHRLKEAFPQHGIVLSCSGKPREQSAMDELLAQLLFQPLQVFRGTLDIPQLYQLIKGAALHLGGDSGGVHLAWLANTPSVSWFRPLGMSSAWAPQGAHHRLVYATDQRRDYLRGVDLGAIVSHARSLLE